MQIAETRQAFFAGASVLFETIMKVLDTTNDRYPGLDETEADIGNEIVEFGQALDKKILKPAEH